MNADNQRAPFISDCLTSIDSAVNGIQDDYLKFYIRLDTTKALYYKWGPLPIPTFDGTPTLDLIVGNQGWVTVRNTTERNMDDPSYFEDFLRSGLAQKADNYALFLWDHGGAYKGFYPDDEPSKKRMFTPEIHDSIMSVLADTGKRFVLFGYDAAMMGNLETMYPSKDYADYYVGSFGLQPGAGWDWTAFRSISLNSGIISPVTLAQNIGSKFLRLPTSSQSGGVAFGVYDLSKIEDARNGLEDFAQLLLDAPSGDTENILFSLLRSRFTSYAPGSYTDSDFQVYDIIEILKDLKQSSSFPSQYKSAVQDTIQQLLSPVISYYTDNSTLGTSGVSLYYPDNSIDYDWTFSASDYFPNWNQFLLEYHTLGNTLRDQLTIPQEIKNLNVKVQGDTLNFAGNAFPYNETVGVELYWGYEKNGMKYMIGSTIANMDDVGNVVANVSLLSVPALCPEDSPFSRCTLPYTIWRNISPKVYTATMLFYYYPFLYSGDYVQTVFAHITYYVCSYSFSSSKTPKGWKHHQ
uniref:Uncharacterized protein n=1 Tax=Arcella intermedia TaxID=1963864 RepID=A0A6B2L0H8_9EUKA